MSTPPRATRQSFAGRDLRHRTLDRHSFKLCDFRGADLRGASLRGASFAGCDLRDTDLSYARFSHALTHDPEYGHTDVTRARWNGANLRGVTAERVIGWTHDRSDSGVTSG
ncbi:pentapeptide repeat-containing protein [Micromonospora chalcea]|uniref:pentapeptide repeat-containing protein n=1 Tax=Micromonospora chalcea TaxID=1874 RepID=UPI0037C6C96C